MNFDRILKKYESEHHNLVRILYRLKKHARRKSLFFLQNYRRASNKDRYAMVRSATWEMAAQLIEKELTPYEIRQTKVRKNSVDTGRNS